MTNTYTCAHARNRGGTITIHTRAGNQVEWNKKDTDNKAYGTYHEAVKAGREFPNL